MHVLPKRFKVPAFTTVGAQFCLSRPKSSCQARVTRLCSAVQLKAERIETFIYIFHVRCCEKWLTLPFRVPGYASVLSENRRSTSCIFKSMQLSHLSAYLRALASGLLANVEAFPSLFIRTARNLLFSSGTMQMR